MSLFNAAALGLLALIPLVVLLYFMKLRRPEHLVSAGFLWRKAMEQARVDSFFERLKINRLLLLQILAILLLTFALARPWLRSEGSIPPEAVIVVDCSASMQAADGGGTRFQNARARALSIVRKAPPGTRFMVVAATARAHVAAPFTSDREAVLKALETLSAQDTRTDLKPALRLALATVQAHPDAQIFVLTDRDRAAVAADAGAADSVDGGGSPPRAVHYVPFGRVVANLAITALDARGTEVFVAVTNDAAAPGGGYLELYQGSRLVDARDITVPAGGRKAFVFSVAAADDPVIEARLEPRDKDALPADNRAWTVLPASAAPRVLLVTAGNPFLERALTLLPGMRIFKVKPADHGPGSGGRDYAITVWDGVLPPADAAGSHLVLNPPAGSGLFEVGEERKGPFSVAGDTAHPVFRFVDMGLVTVSAARALSLPATAKVLARSGDVPLAAALDRPGLRAVVLAFDPYKSDFPLSPAFPIFIANSVAWLGGPGLVRPPAAVRTEDAIPLEFVGATGTLRIETPDGGARDLPMRDLGQTFTETARAGVYRFKLGDRTWAVAVNLLDAAESSLKPPASSESPDRPARAGLAQSFAREIWWELALLGLMIVMGEWWMYHRGAS